MIRAGFWAMMAFLALGALAALAAAVWLGGCIAAAFGAWRRGGARNSSGKPDALTHEITNNGTYKQTSLDIPHA